MAYRQANPSNDKPKGLPPILLLHGIGSHSYCFRDLMRLLADQGYTVYAVDWPGHGASDKVQLNPVKSRR
jgi:pimeloyl-ACP methyl ester carboxylesterase